jgi:hypothetical protein
VGSWSRAVASWKTLFTVLYSGSWSSVTPPKGIVNANANVLVATCIALAEINADEGAFTFAVNSVSTNVDTVRKIQIHIQAALLGDEFLGRISYQANVLIRKAS